MSKNIWRLLICVAVAFLTLLFFWWGAFQNVEMPIVRTHQAPRLSNIRVGQTLEQSLEFSPGIYTGAVLYSRAPLWLDQRIEVSLVDSKGKVLATSLGLSTSYDDDGLLRLEFLTNRFSVPVVDRGTIRIEHHGGPALSLAASANLDEIHVPGTLYRNGNNRHRVLALSLLQPARMASPARLGAVAGVIVFLGIALIEFVEVGWVRGKKWWLYGILLLIATLVALSGFWFSGHFLGIADWDYYFSLHTYYRNIILQYHQFPFWNPYTCGGTAGLGDPEFPGFTVTFLWELLLGIPAGIRVAIFTSVATGGLGMLVLGKKLKLSPLPAFLSALVATFSTVSLLEIVEGHVNVLAAMWIPWIFWAWLGAYQTPSFQLRSWFNRWTLLCSLFLALTFYAGGIYLLMYVGLAFLFLWVLVAKHTKAIVITLVAGAVALGLAGFKLFPVLDWLDEFPDQSYTASTSTLPWMAEILLGRHLHGDTIIFLQDSGWHEYGAYVGAVAVGLALIGAVVYRKKRVVQALLIATGSAMLLSAAGPSLQQFFDPLWFFPRSNISRFILFAVIPLAFLAGFGGQYFWRKKLSPLFLILVTGCLAIELMTLISPLSYQAFVLPSVYPLIPAPTMPLEFTAQRYDDAGQGSRTTRAYAAAREGYGIATYCSVLGPGVKSTVRTVEDGIDNAPVWVEDSKAAVTLVSWTPNTVVMKVDAPAATKIGLNTNFVEGWWVNGERASEFGDRVGHRIAAGENQQFVFEYKAPGLSTGVAVTSVTVVGLLLGWGITKKRKRSN